MNEIEMMKMITFAICDAIIESHITTPDEFALSIDIESQIEIAFDDDDFAATIPIPAFIDARDRAIAYIKLVNSRINS